MDQNHIRKTKILIADDEELARKRIFKFLNESLTNVQIFEASNGKEAIELLNSVSLDIVFLDIKMTDMSGFDVLRQIHSHPIPIIIFVTAFNNFAVRAFDVQAVDFLLKPYTKKRFNDALNRGIRQLELENRENYQTKISQLMQYMEREENQGTAANQPYLDSIVLKKKKRYYFVRTKDIRYIKSVTYYAEIYTKSLEKHLHRISMNQLNEQLNPKEFFRISRSVIVALESIKEVISEGQGDYSVKMDDGLAFPVGLKYRKGFLKIMGIK